MSKKKRQIIDHVHLDEPYEFDYLPKDRPYNEERYKKFIGTLIKKKRSFKD